MKKHFTQMTPAEISHLEARVRTLGIEPIPHAIDRMREKKVSERELEIAINYGKIIEAHNDIPGEVRVLLRAGMKGWHVCAVVSLTTGRIITTYKNKSNDHHSTLDRSVYNWKENLLSI